MRSNRLSEQLGGEKEASEFRPQLTSLIDVMTILLVFLIQNFSVDGNLITPSENLTLPESSIAAKPEMMITVSITADAVLVDGEKVVDVASFKTQEEYAIPDLMTRMKVERERVIVPQMMLEADKELPFNIIKRVAFTCNRAGFEDFSVLVYEEEK